MPTIYAPGYVRVVFRCTLLGEDCENVLWVSAGDLSQDEETVQNIADAARDAFIAEVLPQMVTTVDFTEVEATGWDNESTPRAIATSLIPAGGGINQDQLPNEAAFCLKKDTVARVRGARGKLYHYGLPTSGRSDANHLTEIYANAIRDAWQAVHDAIVPVAGSGASMQVMSFVLGGLPRTFGVGYPYSLVTYSDLTIDSMKSRKPR
jgi:hypothetical protein